MSRTLFLIPDKETILFTILIDLRAAKGILKAV
jgi:hypothetical protein